MFEVWVNEENPSLHLVKAPETPFPDPRPMLNWSLLGIVRVSEELAAAVARDGVAEVTSVVPFDPAGVFGPVGLPVGAQNNTVRE